MPTQIVAAAFGGPEVLTVAHRPVADPPPGQVTVEVRAAGMNPVDYKRYSGAMGADPGALPMPIGAEVAGVVTAVGDGARSRSGAVAVGDEVIVYPMLGGYADVVTVPASSVVPKPAAMSFSAAAGLMLAGTTAIHALTAVGVIGGTSVLIHGASGGVGLIAAQVALVDGATVIGTASERHHERLRGYGIVPVAYGDGLAERVRDAAPRGIDAAIDCVGTDEAVDVSLELVDRPAQLVTIAAWQRLGNGMRGVGGRPGTDTGARIRDAARLALTALVDDGRLDVVVAAEYPLAQAADATRLLAAGHAGGKVVLLP